MEHITDSQLASHLSVSDQIDYWNNLIGIPVITTVEVFPIADLLLAGYTIQAGR